MKLSEIRKMPRLVFGSHDSVLRSYHIVQKVKECLANGVPHVTIMEIIDDLEQAPEPSPSIPGFVLGGKPDALSLTNCPKCGKFMGHGDGMRLFQITEDDLAELERTLPDLLGPSPRFDNNPDRVRIRRVMTIVQSVRWNYGPVSDVTEIQADGSGGE